MEKDVSIVITEKTNCQDEMAEVLEQIAKMLRDGYTAGHNPNWVLSIKE